MKKQDKLALEFNIKKNKIMNNTVFEIGGGLVSEGKRIYGPFDLQAGAQNFVMSIDSTQHLNGNVFVYWNLQISQDGGITYRDVGGGGRNGGIHVNEETGQPIKDFFFETGLPQPENPNRKIKIVFDVQGGSITTAGGTLKATA